MDKHWQITSSEDAPSQHLMEAIGVPSIIANLLVQRGIYDFDSSKAFFRPLSGEEYSPFLLKDLERAITRIHTAIEQGETILLVGDFDVDGVTSVVMLSDFFGSLHPLLKVYMPDRIKEGYGISPQAIHFGLQQGAKLLISLDCGIKNATQIAFAKENGIDTIVVDHHMPDEHTPQAFAIINPMQPECDYPNKNVSAGLLAYKLAQAYSITYKKDIKHLQSLEDLMAFSLACDLMPLTGENRRLMTKGLQRLNQFPRPGIKAILAETRRKFPLVVSDLVFGLGPLINAAGRLGNANDAVQTLLTKTMADAQVAAKKLAQLNRWRQEMDASTLKTAQEMAASPEQSVQKCIILCHTDWHQGILGITASRISDIFNKPTLIITQTPDYWIGSGRSIAGFDIYAALQHCSKHLQMYGGHAHAAGFKVYSDQVEAFTACFQQYAQENIQEKQLISTIQIAAALPLDDITPKFWALLKQFAPFGPGNRNPVFYTTNVKVIGDITFNTHGNVFFQVQQEGSERTMPCIAFGLADKMRACRHSSFDIAFVLQEDYRNKNRRLTLQVKDVRFSLRSKEESEKEKNQF